MSNSLHGPSSGSLQEAEGNRIPSALADWAVLTKPRIASFVFLAALIGGLLGAGPGVQIVRVLEAALWVTCAAASASVLNQVLERDVDRLMARTSGRPLAAGRMSPASAIGFGAALALAGVLGLALRFNLLSATLSLATLFAYVAVYTPLKRVSSLNTLAGALPGAAPPLLGFVALAGAPGPWAYALFAILFAWQFPHFMAIAWLYRADYARAGLKMMPALPGAEGVAGRQAVAYSLVLLPVALLPAVWGVAGVIYAAGALLLGLAYAAASVRFALVESEARARALLFTSLVYVPALLSLILFDPVVRLALVS